MQPKRLYLLFTACVIIGACRKENDIPADPPLITGTSTISAGVGDTVTVIGKNFSFNATKDILFLNLITVPVISATDTSLSFVVPYFLQPGKVDVMVAIADRTSRYSFVFNRIPMISTLAGSPIGRTGYLDQFGTKALFVAPLGMVVDTNSINTLYVADSIFMRRVAYDGNVNSAYDGWDGTMQTEITHSANGFYTVGERGVIWRIGGITADVIAGGGKPSATDNGTGKEAFFRECNGIAIDRNNNLYVSESGKSRIRKINANKEVTTIAGPTFVDKTGTVVSIAPLVSITADIPGNVYVLSGNRILKIDTTQSISVFAGSVTPGYKDATGENALFIAPTAIAADKFGNIYVADNGTMIRKVSPSGVVTTVSGAIAAGYTDGNTTKARFSGITHIATDGLANLYIAETKQGRIRKIVF